MSHEPRDGADAPPLDLASLRAEIDRLDDGIVELLKGYNILKVNQFANV